jgi:hypothetical protein
MAENCKIFRYSYQVSSICIAISTQKSFSAKKSGSGSVKNGSVKNGSVKNGSGKSGSGSVLIHLEGVGVVSTATATATDTGTVDTATTTPGTAGTATVGTVDAATATATWGVSGSGGCHYNSGIAGDNRHFNIATYVFLLKTYLFEVLKFTVEVFEKFNSWVLKFTLT